MVNIEPPFRVVTFLADTIRLWTINQWAFGKSLAQKNRRIQNGEPV